MDEDALTAALETARARLHEVSIATRDVKVDTPEQRLLTEIRESTIDHELAERVLPILEVQPEFKDKAPMINSMAGNTGFQSRFVAPVLVREARHRKSAKAAVTWLTKVLGTDSGEVLIIQTLWGISPTQRISMWEGVDLLPFESLPHSRQKERLKDVDWPRRSRLPTPFFAQKPPTAALIAKTKVRPFLIDASTGDNGIRQIRPPLDDIRLCLALEGPSIIIAGPSWFQYVDPDLEAALLFETASYGSQEVLPHHALLTDSPEPANDVEVLVRAYMALKSEKEKKKIRIALERLHQALIRLDPADRAVELSIALEALLIDSSGEHTFKLSYRAALLVSDNVEERITNRGIIEATYDVRSKLLHRGSAKTEVKVKEGQGKKEMPVEEVASKAATITARVIKRIIMEGGLPEWNRFELSDGRTWK